MTPKLKKKYRWILCNKWFVKVLKPMVLTEEELKADKPPNKKPEFDYIPRWTTLGLQAGLTQWWDSEKEVTDVVRALVNDKPELSRFLFVACQVKYVPEKVKAYKQYWFDKYVIKEVKLKIEKRKEKGEALFTDDTKINID